MMEVMLTPIQRVNLRKPGRLEVVYENHILDFDGTSGNSFFHG